MWDCQVADLVRNVSAGLKDLGMRSDSLSSHTRASAYNKNTRASPSHPPQPFHPHILPLPSLPSQGDVIMLLLPNLIEYPIFLLAAIAEGMIVTTANPNLTAHDLDAQITDSGARIVVTTPSLIGGKQSTESQSNLCRISVLLLK